MHHFSGRNVWFHGVSSNVWTHQRLGRGRIECRPIQMDMGNSDKIRWCRCNGSWRTLHSLVDEKEHYYRHIKGSENQFSDNENLLRTEIDLPMKFVFAFCTVIVGCSVVLLVENWFIDTIAAGAAFLAVTAFFFAAVAGYIAEL